jgi:acyl-CoA hydrolase
MINCWQEMYRQKLGSADDAVRLLKDGDAILVPLANGAPVAIGNALGKRIREDGLKDILWVGGVDVKWVDSFSPDIQDRITIDSGFVSAATRYGVQQGLYTYSANRLGQSIDIARDHLPGVTRGAVACVVAPMDEHGYFSTGCAVDIGWGSAKSGKFRHILVEVNENMPRTFGNNQLHISEVSAVVEDNTPLMELPEIPISKEDELIGQYIADLIEDGSCVQIGIGGMPNAIANFLKDKQDLGVHSEMLTDSMVDLYNEGVISCAKKNFMPYKWIGSFALGSRKLYDFIDENPMVEMHSTRFVNDPVIIGKNDKLISVNATMEVDLTGQCASESIGFTQYTGTGGQLDFVQGAWRSKGGKSFLCLYSTYTDKNGEVRSKIVPSMTSGIFTTVSRTDVQYIVTEYGVAYLKGQNLRKRVQELIRIAHPDFRNWLEFEARKMNFIP